MEKDIENSYTCNSYVSTLEDEELKFGRLLLLFEHTLKNQPSTFAFVVWFDGPYLDKGVLLHYVFCTSKCESIINVSKLSTPYVTAFDEQDSNKLWILNML